MLILEGAPVMKRNSMIFKKSDPTNRVTGYSVFPPKNLSLCQNCIGIAVCVEVQKFIVSNEFGVVQPHRTCSNHCLTKGTGPTG